MRPVGALMGAVFVVGVAAGWVRLLPWLLAPEVPAEVVVTFGRLLLAAALRAAVLVGGLAGVGLTVARWREGGELRALEGLGVHPARPLAAAALALVVVALPLLWTADLMSSPQQRSGAVVQRLSDAAERSCGGDALQTRSVPVLGLTWWCTEPPLAVGALGRRGWFSAREVRVSDDLDRVTLTEVTVATTGRVRVEADEATIRGLRAGVAGLAGSGRGWLSAWLGLLGAAGALVLVLSRGALRAPGSCVGVAAGAGVVALLALGRLVPEAASGVLFSGSKVALVASGLVLLSMLIELAWLRRHAFRRLRVARSPAR